MKIERRSGRAKLWADDLLKEDYLVKRGAADEMDIKKEMWPCGI